MGFDVQTATFKQILGHVAAGGLLRQEEVRSLRDRLFADGRIGREDARLLLDVNKATAPHQQHDPAWQTLFVEGVASYVLDDPNSPHRVDESEGTWLVSRIGKNSQCDANEQALLAHLRKKAKLIEPSLKRLMEKHKL